MKITSLTLLLAGVAGAAPAVRADAAHDGKLMPVDARYAFVPVGFDDNDNVEVVLDGYLPSGCYRLAQPTVTIDLAARKIAITPMARYFDVPCIEALVPFSQEIKLGILPSGTYTVDVRDGALKQTLAVATSTTIGPDDFLYAAVDQVDVTQTGAALTATLKGRFTNTCMTWDDVRVQDNGASLNILPIIKMTTEACQPGEVAYTKTIALPATVTLGRHLLHTRSLNGKAVNHLFYKNR